MSKGFGRCTISKFKCQTCGDTPMDFRACATITGIIVRCVKSVLWNEKIVIRQKLKTVFPILARKNGFGFEMQSLVAVIFVLFLFIRRSFIRLPVAVVPQWLEMAVGISAETIIANGMGVPVWMGTFPSMKTINAEWVGAQPDITRAQIKINAADYPDIFIPIPDVSVRNRHR